MNLDKIISETKTLILSTDDGGVIADCAKRTVNEIASEYFPLKMSEKIVFENKRADYENFARYPLRIYSVKFEGRECDYEEQYDALKAEFSGEAVVTYSFKPFDGDLEPPKVIMDKRVDARTAAYGTAAECCLINGLYDDAAMWDKRFRDSLFRLKVSANGRIPSRGWL